MKTYKKMIIFVFIFTLMASQMANQINLPVNSSNNSQSKISEYIATTANVLGVVLIDDEHSNDYFPTGLENIIDDLFALGYVPFFTSELGG